MLAVQIDSPGPISSLAVRAVPDPRPGPTEVKLGFLASSINPADVKIRTGAVVPIRGAYPYTLGYDLVANVVEVGSEVTGFAPGDRVLAMSTVALTGRGTWSEFVCLPGTSVTHLPPDLDAATAARLPLIGLTALQAVRRAAVTGHESVLVAGAAGSIGRLLIQLLLHDGARVHGLVRRDEQLGQLPRHPRFTAHARVAPAESVDVVIDAAGGDFSAALVVGGRYVCLVPDRVPASELLDQRSITRSVLVTKESGDDLAMLVKLVRTGVLTLDPPRTFPLRNVQEAHKEYEQNGRRNIVLVRD